MTEKIRPCCANCPFGDSKGLAEGDLCCRIDPPRVCDDGTTRWPRPGPEEWCGRHPRIEQVRMAAAYSGAMGPALEQVRQVAEELGFGGYNDEE